MRSGVCVALSIPCVFVGAIRVCDARGVDRNHVSSIRRRAVGVFLACIYSLVLTAVCTDEFAIDNPFVQFGRIISVLFMTMTLFIGPLTVLVCTELHTMRRYLDRDVSLFSYIVNKLPQTTDERWRLGRDVVLAPIGEEICFRACVIHLLTPYTLTSAQAIYMTPMLFAGAHFHHLVQRVRHGDTIMQAALETAFQSVYTYAFGVYAAYVYVRTRALWPAVGAHMFCNAIGHPDVHALVDTDSSRNTRIFYTCAYVLGVIVWVIAMINFTHKYTLHDDLRQ